MIDPLSTSSSLCPEEKKNRHTVCAFCSCLNIYMHACLDCLFSWRLLVVLSACVIFLCSCLFSASPFAMGVLFYLLFLSGRLAAVFLFICCGGLSRNAFLLASFSALRWYVHSFSAFFHSQQRWRLNIFPVSHLLIIHLAHCFPIFLLFSPYFASTPFIACFSLSDFLLICPIAFTCHQSVPGTFPSIPLSPSPLSFMPPSILSFTPLLHHPRSH